MQLVLRTVNDQFFEQIVFPIFEMGMVNAETALDRLLPQISDDRAGALLETLLERGAAAGTALWNLEQELWMEAVHRLIFCEWGQGEDGRWQVTAEDPGFAGDWGLMLHLALMVESPHFPYDDETQASAIVQQLVTEPAANLGLAAFFSGLWDPAPRFPAHEVLSVIQDRGVFKGDRCVADWSYRPAETVALWMRQLSTKLGRMLRREETRLSMTLPDTKAVLDYWTGNEPTVPPLPVPFSGLGADSHLWVERIGEITGKVRTAAAAGRGLSMIVTRSTGSFEERFL